MKDEWNQTLFPLAKFGIEVLIFLAERLSHLTGKIFSSPKADCI